MGTFKNKCGQGAHTLMDKEHGVMTFIDQEAIIALTTSFWPSASIVFVNPTAVFFDDCDLDRNVQQHLLQGNRSIIACIETQ